MDAMEAAQKSENSTTSRPASSFEHNSSGYAKDLDTKPNNDRPCDVTLVAGGGKEFKAHRHVLAESSPFFERLFNTDMKESNEGVIRLEILSEAALNDVLEFIYTGTVELLSEKNAKELIVASNYLLFPKLQTFAVRFLEKTVCVSNCLSYLNLAEKHQCEELAHLSKDFIHVNFQAVAESKEFLDLSSQEVERWISSDDIDVSAEEDVFEIICRWIKKKKLKRKPKFNELFRHVRLIFISLEYLSKVKKKSLVKNNKQCLASVTSAMNWLDRAPELDLPRPHSIRKSLEKHAVVIAGKRTVCYLPDTDTWYELPESPSKPTNYDVLVPIRGRVEKFSHFSDVSERYDALLNRWTILTDSRTPCKAGNRHFDTARVIVTGKDMYATPVRGDGESTAVAVWKYNVMSESWQSIRLKDDVFCPCVVFVDKYVYVIGGFVSPHEATAQSARLDTIEDKWEKIADLKTARCEAFGVAAHGKIFVVGGKKKPPPYTRLENHLTSCEVYNMQTNKWHFIANLPYLRQRAQMLCHGSKLYVVGGQTTMPLTWYGDAASWMECYDIERNEWSPRIPIPKPALFEPFCNSRISACSLAVPKRTLDTFRRLEDDTGRNHFNQAFRLTPN